MGNEFVRLLKRSLVPKTKKEDGYQVLGYQWWEPKSINLSEFDCIWRKVKFLSSRNNYLLQKEGLVYIKLFEGWFIVVRSYELNNDWGCDDPLMCTSSQLFV